MSRIPSVGDIIGPIVVLLIVAALIIIPSMLIIDNLTADYEWRRATIVTTWTTPGGISVGRDWTLWEMEDGERVRRRGISGVAGDVRKIRVRTDPVPWWNN